MIDLAAVTALATTTSITTAKVIVSQGPAAAGIGTANGDVVVVAEGIDADRNFAFRLVAGDDREPVPLPIESRLTPVLAGGADGRLYVVDVAATTLSAYSMPDGRLIDEEDGATCSTPTVTRVAVSCGPATIASGPVIASGDWWLQSPMTEKEVSALPILVGGSTTCELGGCTHYVSSNGVEVDVVTFDRLGTTATLLLIPSTQTSFILPTGDVACLLDGTVLMWVLNDSPTLQSVSIPGLVP